MSCPSTQAYSARWPPSRYGRTSSRPGQAGCRGWSVGKARYERERTAAWQRFQQALAEQELAEEIRRRRLAEARRRHEQQVAELTREVVEHNAAVDKLAADVHAGVPDAVEEYFEQVLAQSTYPEEFPQDYEVAYRPEPQELVIKYWLPGSEVVPLARGYRYVKTRQEIDPLPRPVKEIKELYATVIAQLALRTMRECFAVPVIDVVDSVVFSGHVKARDRATGREIEPCVISVGARREVFDELVLDELDAAACLTHLKAIMSPHPYDLAPVEPLIKFEYAKYRFAEPIDALAGMDSRQDLLKMDWYRFENLVRQLFEAMGMTVSITRSSRDEGIDAVAYLKTDVVHRAEYIIQAKRYSKCVPTESVRALAGVVEEKRATAGILVTTSWVGPESKTFVARNNRLTIIEGGELKHLLAEHLHVDVRIEFPRKSPRR
ncbi:MAG: restriction endonuclease [Pseudonocardiales bacterium]|nr:restriction endonuclease [Pseudonocardiales bacterium]MBV9032369.1 restriction endonuclease [Pseudonocardiales bacterium]MBW0008888.1 restriction endonuclease [Pseudonocardiales bacterium]